MKKLTSRLVPTLLAAALLAGCGSSSTPPAKSPDGALSTPEQTAGTVKTGLAVVTSLDKSADASAEKAGLVQADSIIIGVTVDADGKIIACAIDSAQTKVDVDTAGQITTALDTEFKTKNELGAEYGMIKGSSIQKEWNEQAKALADYVIGKTADEVKGIAVDDEQRAADADLKASVTISIGSYLDAIGKAVANATDLGAAAADKLSLGTLTSIENSKNAGAENGEVEVYSTYTALTTDGSGKITSCVIDSSQAKAQFDATGKLTSDITVPVKAKNELGAEYGLAKTSSIQKEWNEQAAAFAKYATGKTAAEVQGIAVDEKGATSDADLKSSVTIGIQNFQTIIAKAAQ